MTYRIIKKRQMDGTDWYFVYAYDKDLGSMGYAITCEHTLEKAKETLELYKLSKKIPDEVVLEEIVE